MSERTREVPKLADVKYVHTLVIESIHKVGTFNPNLHESNKGKNGFGVKKDPTLHSMQVFSLCSSKVHLVLPTL